MQKKKYHIGTYTIVVYSVMSIMFIYIFFFIINKYNPRINITVTYLNEIRELKNIT